MQIKLIVPNPGVLRVFIDDDELALLSLQDLVGTMTSLEYPKHVPEVKVEPELTGYMGSPDYEDFKIKASDN